MEAKNFNFWCPVEIQKSELDPLTGKPKKMKLGGIASTADEDSDGEFLDPAGFDISPLVERGVVNWHHQAKNDPSAIIGEPINVKIDKRGLYLEADLYPDSKIANDVYNLAETLEKNSKTRRLGFSIEGKVLERESDDKNDPRYNHVKKAVITGVAITHMPKNPKTFANIIKGETDTDIEDMDEHETEEAQPQLNFLSKGEVYDRIFHDIPGISIDKAIQIENLITKLSRMKKRMITNEDIEKAYEALGLEKADDDDDFGKKNPEAEDDENDDEAEKAEEVEEEMEEEVEEKEPKKTDNNDDEDDEIEEGCGIKKIKKSEISNISKAIATSHAINEKYFKAIGSIIKDNNSKFTALEELVKAQDETISELRSAIEAFGAEVPAPKSISHARPVERAFQKGNDTEPMGGEAGNVNALSISRDKRKIVDILDQATFAKGYDAQFSHACTQFESSGIMPADVAKRLQTEFGIQITK